MSIAPMRTRVYLETTHTTGHRKTVVCLVMFSSEVLLRQRILYCC